MGRNKGGALDAKHRRKGPVGSGRSRKRDHRIKARSKKDAEDQLAALQKERKKKLEKDAKAAKQQEGKSKDGKAKDGHPQEKSTGFEKGYRPEVLQAIPFERYFWLGDRPQSGEPDQALKLQRKELGLKVKGSALPSPVSSFADPGLPPSFKAFYQLKRGKEGTGIQKPTPIQAQVWPAALCGNDIIGIAPTGSGKTFAYVLPAVPHILGQPENPSGKGRGLVCLVLAPTRELAKQVCDTCGGGASGGWLKRLFGLRAGAIYGGVGKEMQIDGMVTLGVPEIICATPGRLLDLLGLSIFKLEKVTYLVLDEADRMLQLGFEPQLSAIMKGIRPNRQVLLFSATFPQRLQNAAEEWMASERAVIRVATMEVDGPVARDQPGDETKAAAPETEADQVDEDEEPQDACKADAKVRDTSTLTVSPTVHQTVHVCAEHKKLKKIVLFFERIRKKEKDSGARQRAAVLVFCTQIKTLKSVAQYLQRYQERCAVVHSGIPQSKREEALADLKSGKVDTVVATDVASRGLHISRLQYVVNYDFPTSLEVYCHRIGRVGRQGTQGWAVSMFTRNLAPMAAGLVGLLERCSQSVDPNLRALAEGKDPGGKPQDAGDEDRFVEEEEELPADAGSKLKFAPGCAVRLMGLSKAKHLNGATGRVCRWISSTQRWEVVLQNGADVKAVTGENLEVVPGDEPEGETFTGALVKITGLETAPRLNGKKATVRRRDTSNGGNWEVVLDDSGEVVSVPSANIAVTLEEARKQTVDKATWKDKKKGAKASSAKKRPRQGDESDNDSDASLPQGGVGRGGGLRIQPTPKTKKNTAKKGRH